MRISIVRVLNTADLLVSYNQSAMEVIKRSDRSSMANLGDLHVAFTRKESGVGKENETWSGIVTGRFFSFPFHWDSFWLDEGPTGY